MVEKILMVALVAHQTGTPVGMVQVGEKFEVSPAVAEAYERREKRPLAKRSKGKATRPSTAETEGTEEGETTSETETVSTTAALTTPKRAGGTKTSAKRAT